MSYYRRSIDNNHKEVADYLRNHGLQVIDLSAVGGGMPDLLVSRAGMSAFVEVKTADKKNYRQAEFKRSQVKWISDAREVNVLIAKTGEEAVRKFRHREFISRRAKDCLAAIHALAPKDKKTFQESELEDALSR